MRLDSKVGTGIHKMLLTESESLTHCDSARTAAPQECITFQIKGHLQVTPLALALPWWTILNGIDCLRSPSTSQSHLSWRFLKKNRSEGKLGTKDRRKEGFVPECSLGSGRILVH